MAYFVNADITVAVVLKPKKVFEVAVVVKHSDLENVDMCNDLEVVHSAVVNFGHQHVAVYLRNVHLLIYSLNT